MKVHVSSNGECTYFFSFTNIHQWYHDMVLSQAKPNGCNTYMYYYKLIRTLPESRGLLWLTIRKSPSLWLAKICTGLRETSSWRFKGNTAMLFKYLRAVPLNQRICCFQLLCKSSGWVCTHNQRIGALLRQMCASKCTFMYMHFQTHGIEMLRPWGVPCDFPKALEATCDGLVFSPL